MSMLSSKRKEKILGNVICCDECGDMVGYGITNDSVYCKDCIEG